MMLKVRRPSPAMFVAILALAAAMSGTAAAVVATVQNGDTLIAKNSLSGNRLRTNTVTSTQVANLDWGGVILRSGWTNTARPAMAAIDAQGIVHFRGAVKRSSTALHTVGTVQKSLEPTRGIYLTAMQSNGTPVGVVVGTNGVIAVLGAIGGPQVVLSLDGLTYAR